MTYQVWDLRSGNRLFQCASRRIALLWVLQVLPSQGVDDIAVIGPGDESLEGEALLSALGEALWGHVEQMAEPTGALEVQVARLQAEVVYAA